MVLKKTPLLCPGYLNVVSQILRKTRVVSNPTYKSDSQYMQS